MHGRFDGFRAWTVPPDSRSGFTPERPQWLARPNDRLNRIPAIAADPNALRLTDKLGEMLSAN